jgi:hypothetical protein
MAVVFALAAVTLCGVMALGADVGVLYYNWVQLQKAADSAAIAGANYAAKDPSMATTTATAYAKNNGILDSEIVSVTPTATQMQVTLSRTVPYSFARVLGLTNGLVNASAIAAPPQGISTVNAGPSNPVSCSGSPCTSGGNTVVAGSGAFGSGTPFAGGCGASTGAYNVLPMALDDKTTWVANTSYTLNRVDASTVKGNANGPWPDAPGNWGFVQLCGNNNGNGGSGLRATIAGGYYGELSIGNTLSTLPGVKNGPVSQGLQGLLDRAPVKAVTPNSFDPTDPRAVIIPTASFVGCTGQCTLMIDGFMAFYLNRVYTASDTSVNGGNGAIAATFVKYVVPNSQTSVNAPLNGALGDVVVIR